MAEIMILVTTLDMMFTILFIQWDIASGSI